MLLVKCHPRLSSLDRWDPLAGIADLRRGMDRVLEQCFAQPSFGVGAAEMPWSPRVDVSEANEKIVLRAELPGVKQEDIQVSILDDTLTLTAERKREGELKEDHCHRSERAYGTFQRSLVLPATVDQERAKATYRDGVLEIQLPKREEAKPKQIKVEVA